MKTRPVAIFIFLLGCFQLYAQKPVIHLYLAADIEDSKYGVKSFSKEEKMSNIFNLVKDQIDFDLKINYLHKSDFTTKNTLHTLGQVKLQTKDDLIIFFYSGRGFYKNPNDKFPLLEYRDTKKTLTFDQIREKVKPIGARLVLVLADCDESYTLAHRETLPVSIIKTTYVPGFDEVDQSILASLADNLAFSYPEKNSPSTSTYSPKNLPVSRPNSDSVYYKQVIEHLRKIIGENLSKNSINLFDPNKKRAVYQYKRILEYAQTGFPVTDTLLKVYELENTKQNISKIIDYAYFNKKIIVPEIELNDLLNRVLESSTSKDFMELVKPKEYLRYTKIKEALKERYTNENVDEDFSLNAENEWLNVRYDVISSYPESGFPGSFYSSPLHDIIANKITIENGELRNSYIDSQIIKALVDSLYINNMLLNKNHPLNLYLDTLIAYNKRKFDYSSTLSPTEKEYYQNSLDLLYARKSTSKDPVLIKSLAFQIKVLENYKVFGFPKSPFYRAYLWSELPDITQEKTENSSISVDDLKPLVDSLYASKSILKNDAFDTYFNQLIRYILSPVKSFKDNLKKRELRYYEGLLRQIEDLKSAHSDLDRQTVDYQKLVFLKNILNAYAISGFPDKWSKKVKHKLLQVSQGQFKTENIAFEDLKYLVDKLYLRKDLLKNKSPLENTLNSYLEYNLRPVNKALELNSMDSAYYYNSLQQLEEIYFNLQKNGYGEDTLKKVSILREIIKEYPIIGFPSYENSSNLPDFPYLLNQKYRTSDVEFKDYKAFVDFLFVQKSLLDFDNPIQIILGDIIRYSKKTLVPKYLMESDKDDLDYYVNTMEILKNRVSDLDETNLGNIANKRNLILFDRLKTYDKYGLPKKENSYRNYYWQKLPKISKSNFKIVPFSTSDLNYVVDSLFIRKAVLSETDPVVFYLDSLIEYAQRPLKYPIEFLDSIQLDNYYITLDHLNRLLSDSLSRLSNDKLKERVRVITDRLNQYPDVGFPYTANNFYMDFSKLPFPNKTKSINLLVDSLFVQNKLLDFNYPLNTYLDSPIDDSENYFLKKIDQKERLYYKTVVATLNKHLDSLLDITGGLESYKIISTYRQRLKEYLVSGFPDKNIPVDSSILFPEFNHTYYYEYEVLNEKKYAYDLLIDSLYIGKAILYFEHPFYYLIDYILQKFVALTPLPPTSEHLQESAFQILLSENFQKPSIMKLFLGECGVIEIANGHKNKLAENTYIKDYTSFVYDQFNKVIDPVNLVEIEKLSLASVFSKMDKKHSYGYNFSVKNNCSSVSQNVALKLPNFSKLLSSEEIGSLFFNYAKAQDVLNQNKYRVQLKEVFEQNATIMAKSVFPNTTNGRLKRFKIDEYLDQLKRNTIIIKELNVPSNSMVRNQNFSKVKNAMVVEK